MSCFCFGGLRGILARSLWERRGVGDLGPMPSFPSVTSTPEFRPGAFPLSPAEGHLQRWNTWAWAWLRGALEGSAPLTESEQLFLLPLSALALAWLWTDPPAPQQPLQRGCGDVRQRLLQLQQTEGTLLELPLPLR